MGHTEGIIRFNVELSVPLAEMKDWPAGRIEQFFRGLSIAISARDGIPVDKEVLMKPATVTAVDTAS